MAKLLDPPELPEGTETVVKVQRPLGRPHLSWMVFAENFGSVRLYKAEQVPGWVRQVMHDMRKAYFRAVVQGGQWVILERVPDQRW